MTLEDEHSSVLDQPQARIEVITYSSFSNARRPTAGFAQAEVAVVWPSIKA
jgi:hypothetical protein